MNKEHTTVHAGIGTTGLLTVALIVLKLLGKIDWPWIWVLAPAWVGVFLGILAVVIFFAFIWRA